MDYLDALFPERPIAQRDPYRHAVENMLTRMEGEPDQFDRRPSLTQAFLARPDQVIAKAACGFRRGVDLKRLLS